MTTGKAYAATTSLGLRGVRDMLGKVCANRLWAGADDVMVAEVQCTAAWGKTLTSATLHEKWDEGASTSNCLHVIAVRRQDLEAYCGP